MLADIHTFQKDKVYVSRPIMSMIIYILCIFLYINAYVSSPISPQGLCLVTNYVNDYIYITYIFVY